VRLNRIGVLGTRGQQSRCAVRSVQPRCGGYNVLIDHSCPTFAGITLKEDAPTLPLISAGWAMVPPALAPPSLSSDRAGEPPDRAVHGSAYHGRLIATTAVHTPRPPEIFVTNAANSLDFIRKGSGNGVRR
jgi:hypothetical protein